MRIAILTNWGLHTFDVSVQLLVTVEIVQPAQKLPQNNSNVLLVDHTRSQETVATTTSAELHDDPQVGPLQV